MYESQDEDEAYNCISSASVKIVHAVTTCESLCARIRESEGARTRAPLREAVRVLARAEVRSTQSRPCVYPMRALRDGLSRVVWATVS